MAVNEFYEFATDEYAYVEDLATYFADTERTAGQQSGIARAAINNRALRQGAGAAAALGTFVAGQGYDFKDDGNTAARAQAIQDAITSLIQPSIDVAITSARLNILQTVFPIGAYYFSHSVATNPRDLFGFGTWARVEGRFLLGASSAYPAGSTGGAASVTLSVNNLPAHNHTASTGAAGEHTHTASSANAGAHTHSVSGTAAQGGAHTHTATTSEAGEHSHTASSSSTGDHTHTATTSNAGAHTHTRGTMEISGQIGVARRGGSAHDNATGVFRYASNWNAQIKIGGSDDWGSDVSFLASRSWTGNTNSAGGHTHTATTNNAGAHSHAITVNNSGKHTHRLTTASGGAHAHTVSATAASAGGHSHNITVNRAGSHSHSVTIGNTGGGAAFSIMPPYQSIYIWRRTA